MTINNIREFLKTESAGGIILFGVAILALIMVNSPLGPLYDSFLHLPVAIQVGNFILSKHMLHWINDGFMAIFFLLVALEIKREIVEGELSTLDKASLPIVAAIGGMVVPALTYVFINQGTGFENGWAIPTATDIAFALGILSLLGPRVPTSLKIFLLAIAIIDDLGAITIIALFYSSDLAMTPLLLSIGGLVLLGILNGRGSTRIAPFILVGVALWLCLLKSGIHATLAGVIVGLSVPLHAKDGTSPLEHLEHILHPWVAFMIMPLFAFANAGISFDGITLSTLTSPLPLGILLGLFIGKQIGVFGFTYAAVKAGICRLPEGISWPHVYGLSLLTGIGFTMSLFIGSLAFTDATLEPLIRLGVLVGSTGSALLGFMVLKASLGKEPNGETPAHRATDTV